MQLPYEEFDVKDIEWRVEWRNFFNDTLKIYPKEPLDEIPTLEERKEQRRLYDEEMTKQNLIRQAEAEERRRQMDEEAARAAEAGETADIEQAVV